MKQLNLFGEPEKLPIAMTYEQKREDAMETGKKVYNNIIYKYRCMNCGDEFIEIVPKENLYKKMLALVANNAFSREFVEEMVDKEIGLRPTTHFCGGESYPDTSGICYPYQIKFGK